MANEKSDLQRMLEETDLNVRSYSGRGMFGKTCLGVEGDGMLDMFHRILESAQETGVEVDTLEEAFRDAKSDNMGRGTIIYFSNIPFITDEEDEEAMASDPDEPDMSFDEFAERVDGR